jgi:hypothetical protein
VKRIPVCRAAVAAGGVAASSCPAPQASILFEEFHGLRQLGEALDTVRKSSIVDPAPGG